ncbi:hypothetical protein [Chryseobacterium indologenes]|uniref:hypothetical protein n=1 Tax=Chryseobacterium indologenes TaxID=253 RepID=UPI003D354616
MAKIGDLLYKYIETDISERQNLIPEVLTTLDNMKSAEVDDSFKDGVKENLIYQMENNILTSKEIGEHLTYLAMLKFQ